MNLRPWLANMFLMGCLLCVATANAAEIVIDESTIIDSRLEQTGLRIVDGENPPTIVEFIEPGYVEQSVFVENTSILHMLGGEIHESLLLLDEGVALVSGGTVGDTVRPQGASALVVAGGALLDYIYAADSSTVAISAGTLWGVNATGNTTVTISGGELRAWPQENGLFVDNSAIIVIEGTNFNFPAGAITQSAGTLVGNLGDGTPITADFQVHGNGSIVLVPEPSSILLLFCAAGILWLCLSCAESRRFRWARRPVLALRPSGCRIVKDHCRQMCGIKLFRLPAREPGRTRAAACRTSHSDRRTNAGRVKSRVIQNNSRAHTPATSIPTILSRSYLRERPRLFCPSVRRL